MIEHIAHHTNLYSAQELGDPIKTSPEEIEDFLAILLYMGVFNFPSLEDYWHHESRFNIIADIMPRKRFQLLRRYIHFSDNQHISESPDRFYKIRPLFEMLRHQCLLIPSTNKHSVDEVMVAYKGTRAGTLRQYIANKPDKWGFKLFCRASSSGIIHDLLLYQGASTFFNVALSEQEQMLPLGAKVVTTLCKTIKHPRLSVFFCDNFFTSFSLVQSLHSSLGVKCIGTVRPNRTGGAPLMADKDLMKRGRGACDYRSAEGVIAVKWFDNKCVNLLSNASGILPHSTVKRWSKESRAKIAIPCPSLIPAYNEHMGGIDLSDMLVHLYKTPAKSRRWYLPLFGYVLDLCIANAWLVYKRDCALLKQKPMSLKRFRLAVAHSLHQYNKPASKVGRPSLSSPPRQKKGYTPRPSRPKPQPDVRYDNLGHWPLHCDKRGRCNLCQKGVSRWRCQKCKVFLCLNSNQECFVAYHQK
ncbi:piggyBac transposable element-derived protein 3-like [Notolabrus celidotus]|uniref:piggyBac transposable element-derived protein 3-like n=1 Tax=Notolabrus celidotus TaxID=1203425 RepID=UPI00148F718F|nr:piggyBac transposable element-derived protein 3-like [Notolabrus celidotus]